jgi:hypothetical protein
MRSTTIGSFLVCAVARAAPAVGQTPSAAPATLRIHPEKREPASDSLDEGLWLERKGEAGMVFLDNRLFAVADGWSEYA